MVQSVNPVLTQLPNKANIVEVSSISLPPRQRARIQSFSAYPSDENCKPPALPPKTYGRRKTSPPQLPARRRASAVPKSKSPTTSPPPDVVSSSRNGLSKLTPRLDGSGPLLEMEVNRFLIFKSNEEEGPDIKGGPIDALVVKATEVSKNGLSFISISICLEFKTKVFCSSFLNLLLHYKLKVFVKHQLIFFKF